MYTMSYTIKESMIKLIKYMYMCTLYIIHMCIYVRLVHTCTCIYP